MWFTDHKTAYKTWHKFIPIWRQWNGDAHCLPHPYAAELWVDDADLIRLTSTIAVNWASSVVCCLFVVVSTESSIWTCRWPSSMLRHSNNFCHHVSLCCDLVLSLASWTITSAGRPSPTRYIHVTYSHLCLTLWNILSITVPAIWWWQQYFVSILLTCLIFLHWSCEVGKLTLMDGGSPTQAHLCCTKCNRHPLPVYQSP